MNNTKNTAASIKETAVFYSPSNTASIRIPVIIMAINIYCFLVSFYFKKILYNSNDTTHTQDKIGAAMAPLPLMAYT